MPSRPARALACIATVLMCVAAATAAAADAWPTRPIKIIVSQAPGGVTDVITRIIAQPLGEVLGQSVVVENRPGASGLVGTEVVARAPADGYTLLSFLDVNTIMPFTMKHIDYDPDRSFVPITLVARGSHVIVANPAAPFNNLRELIAYAKAHPGELSYASPATGSPQHLAGETIKREAGIQMTHVPYKGGGQAIIDVVGGQVPLGIVGLAPALPQLRAGKLKAIAVTGDKRSALLPDVPTVAESGIPGFATVQWQGLSAPAGTPPAVVKRLHQAMLEVMRRPEVVDKIKGQGLEAVSSATPDEFQQMIRAELKRWPAVVKAAGVEPE
ncbi:MAG TPA: tripartite tricarboxylate transporter substrate binding protein [Casimicrobiaceae bacterium]|nr:tripartite tricarboxylate transporter substrate binding protein [Casimicrobiaceae bacterium]